MKDRQDQKGIVLLLVIGLSLILFIATMGLLFVLRANTRNIESIRERIEAYYLCETGASVAILDIAAGRIGHGSGQWTTRTFNYTMNNKTYPISYTVTKVRETGGQWQIISEVGSQAGFMHTYKLRVGGRRAFPIFIKGFAGK